MKPEELPQTNVVLCGHPMIVAGNGRPDGTAKISGRRAQVLAARRNSPSTALVTP
jgi:hypothetical protein